MFAQQKKRLAKASVAHNAAIQRKKIARDKLSERRQQFLGEPLNLLYPYSAGILICASQLKNEATGLKRIPFMNVAKTAVGIWTLISRVKKISEKRSKSVEQVPTIS